MRQYFHHKSLSKPPDNPSIFLLTSKPGFQIKFTHRKVLVYFISFLVTLGIIIIKFSDKSVGIKGKEAKAIAYKSWLKLMKSCPIQNDASRLELVLSFPGPEIEKEGRYLNSPTCLCIDSRGDIFVSDMYDHSVHKYDNKGNLIKKIGRGGQAPGELLMPNYLDIDDSDNLVVYDAGNNRVQFFNSDGDYIANFKFFKPYQSMAADDTGLLFLSPLTSDISESLVEVLNKKGNIFASYIPHENNLILRNFLCLYHL